MYFMLCIARAHHFGLPCDTLDSIIGRVYIALSLQKSKRSKQNRSKVEKVEKVDKPMAAVSVGESMCILCFTCVAVNGLIPLGMNACDSRSPTLHR